MGQNNFSLSEPEQGSAFSPALCNEDIQKLLAKSKKEVRAANQEVFTLLESGHKSSAALELKNRLVVLDKYLTNFSYFLEERLDGSEEAKKEELLKGFCRACNQMTNRVDKMNRLLSEDIAVCQHQESKEAIDPLKIATFVVGFPVAIGALAKVIFGEKSDVVPYATFTGAAIGITISFKEKINDSAFFVYRKLGAWKTKVKDSFPVYYISSTAKESIENVDRVVNRFRKTKTKNPAL